MPLELRHLQTNTRSLRVDFGEAGDINLLYRPGNITPNALLKFQRVLDIHAEREANGEAMDIAGSTDYLSTIVTLLRSVIIRWDALQDGEVIPLTDAAVGDVPVDVLIQLLYAVFGDAGMDPTTGMPSQPTSPATTAPKVRTSSAPSGNRASRRNSSKSR